jgi:hypothetical protein
MSEKRIEELGHLAFNEGFFTQWHDTASLYMKENPKVERVEAYEQAYKKYSRTVVNK